MGWTTLTLRKAELRREHAIYEEQDLKLSREKRAVTRQLHYQQTIYTNAKNAALREAKGTLSSLQGDNKKKTTDPDYQNWVNEYNEAKENYEAEKLDINDYYDGILSDIEEEASDREAEIEQQQTEIEALMEDITQEINSVGQAISTQIQSTAIKLS